MRVQTSFSMTDPRIASLPDIIMEGNRQISKALLVLVYDAFKDCEFTRDEVVERLRFKGNRARAKEVFGYHLRFLCLQEWVKIIKHREGVAIYQFIEPIEKWHMQNPGEWQ